MLGMPNDMKLQIDIGSVRIAAENVLIAPAAN
jgi:hypothetical protein